MACGICLGPLSTYRKVVARVLQRGLHDCPASEPVADFLGRLASLGPKVVHIWKQAVWVTGRAIDAAIAEEWKPDNPDGISAHPLALKPDDAARYEGELHRLQGSLLRDWMAGQQHFDNPISNSMPVDASRIGRRATLTLALGDEGGTAMVMPSQVVPWALEEGAFWDTPRL